MNITGTEVVDKTRTSNRKLKFWVVREQMAVSERFRYCGRNIRNYQEIASYDALREQQGQLATPTATDDAQNRLTNYSGKAAAGAIA